MCFIVTIKEPKIEKLAERIGKANRSVPKINFDPALYSPSYFVTGFTFPLLPVAVEDQLELFQWGLIPSWVKDETSAKELRTSTLNAKAETVFEKSSFRKAIASQRCVLPINGFIEWQTLGKEKQPYYIHPKEDDFFLIGGLYDVWSNPATGEMVNTFSIITTEANPLMAEIHNSKKRMPLIVEDRSLNAWLDKRTSAEVIQLIFRPFEECGMTAYQISKQANSARNNRNVPEILNPVDVLPNQGQLSLF